MKRYIRYQLVADFGNIRNDYYNYKDSFVAYQKCAEPKTLYGITIKGGINVIFSK